MGNCCTDEMPAVGGITAFIVLAVGSSSSFQHHFNSLSGRFGSHGDAYHNVIKAASGSIAQHPSAGTWLDPVRSLVPLPERADRERAGADRPDRGPVPVLEPARHGRQLVHAGPHRVRLGVRPAAAPEAGCRTPGTRQRLPASPASGGDGERECAAAAVLLPRLDLRARQSAQACRPPESRAPVRLLSHLAQARFASFSSTRMSARPALRTLTSDSRPRTDQLNADLKGARVPHPTPTRPFPGPTRSGTSRLAATTCRKCGRYWPWSAGCGASRSGLAHAGLLPVSPASSRRQ